MSSYSVDNLPVFGYDHPGYPRRPWTAEELDCIQGYALAAVSAAVQAQSSSVPVPLNEEQAALMQLLSTQWLKDNAPHRLRPDDAKQQQLGTIAFHDARNKYL